LKLNDVARNHAWKVQPSCAKTGDGIFEGLVSQIISNITPMANIEQQWLGANVQVPPK
jgi:ADP-ribosylation factor 6